MFKQKRCDVTLATTEQLLGIPIFFFQLKGAGNSLLGWKLKPRKNFQIVHLRLDWDWHRLKPKPMSFSINSHFKMSKFTALEQIFIDWYQKNKKVFPFIFHFQFRSNSNLPLPVCSFQLHFCCLKMCNVSLLFISFSVTFNLLNYHTHDICQRQDLGKLLTYFVKAVDKWPPQFHQTR